MQLTGIHHLTAVTARIRENRHFFTEVLGLRLVKRTVNQDDVSAYHLFYADGAGSPGTDVTFFDWDVPREVRGVHSITRTCLRVPGDSMDWWVQRFDELGVQHGEVVERDGRLTVVFEDAEGQRLALVDDGGEGDEPVVWERSPIPPEHQIRGIGPVVMSVPTLSPTDVLLTKVLNMRSVRTYPHPEDARNVVHVFEMGQGGAHAELHVAVEPGGRPARPGAGGVHHVAFRTPDEDEYHAWLDRLRTFQIPNSGEVDRYYFRSLYFREPNGVLFEIATDEPGFAVDEDPAELGENVVLPPFFEARREAILANLKPID